MNTTKCPNCESTRFEGHTQTISNYSYDITFIRCSSCRSAVGVLTSDDIPSMIRDIALRLGNPLPD